MVSQKVEYLAHWTADMSVGWWAGTREQTRAECWAAERVGEMVGYSDVWKAPQLVV